VRRFWIVILCLMLLAVPVSALSGVTSAQNQTVVGEDGSCEVTLTVTLMLESAVPDLTYPLPVAARDITVNGAPADTRYTANTRNVDLSKFFTGPGISTLTIHYTLPDVIKADAKGNLTLKMELLSGFGYSIESFRFSVTLPGEAEHVPGFVSTYYQEAVDTVMNLSVNGSVISGAFRERLKDHETLTMSLSVSEEMFPQSMSKRWSMDSLDLMMIFTGVLALAYWLIALRAAPPRRVRRTAPPEGITAGELGCQLTGQGVDFTMMVISWAQMGYILIQPDDNGRVLLHKRMDMGNERSAFENRFFRHLFGKRGTVDGTGYHYARLCRKAMGATPGIQGYYYRSSGNPMVFRVLAAAIAVLSGVSLAFAFVSDTGWRSVLSVPLGLLGFVVGWLIQRVGMSIHRRDRMSLWLGVAAALVWYILSNMVGEWNVALCVIATELLAGLAAAYGGRRTETGKQAMSDILGLRRYLKHISREDLKRILRANPHYYYDMAPYAMALNVDRAFAAQLGKFRLPECPYLTTGMDGHLTAKEWNQLLRDTVSALDTMQRRLPIDRLMGKV